MQQMNLKANNKNEELLQEEFDEEEMEEENENESGNEAPAPSQNSPKDIIIKECTRIIEQYINLAQANNDEFFIKALENTNKTTESCSNHIMNNLVKKQIFGGSDSLMYEYIHEYYVDNFTEVEDNWSNQIRTGSSASVQLTDKQIAEKYQALSNEEKNEIYLKQLKACETDMKYKAQEELRKKEEKRKAKEKELAEKKKAEELARKEADKKAKEEALKNGAREQVSLFDLL